MNHKPSIVDAAYKQYRAALRSGELVRPGVCEQCGTTPDQPSDIHGHHHDYTKPLVVAWLCRPCHDEADRARSAREKEAAHQASLLDRKRLLTPGEVARRLGISVRVVYRRIEDSGLPCLDLGTTQQRRWRVPEDDLAAWLNSRHNQRSEPS